MSVRTQRRGVRMDFNEWLVLANKDYAMFGHKSQRRFGQFLFNHLYYHNERVAVTIVKGVYDPYYNDEIVPAFLGRVANEW